VLTPERITHPAAWNAALRALPCAHVLQTWEWGEFKRATTGWQPLRLAFKHGGSIVAMASVGIRSVGPLKVMYVSKGPALPYDDAAICAEVLDHLQQLARQERAIWLKIDPDVIAATGVPGEADDSPSPTGQALIKSLQARGWRFSPEAVEAVAQGRLNPEPLYTHTFRLDQLDQAMEMMRDRPDGFLKALITM